MLFANVILGVRSLAGELWILFHVQLAPPKFEKAYATFWNFISFLIKTKRIKIFRSIYFLSLEFFNWAKKFWVWCFTGFFFPLKKDWELRKPLGFSASHEVTQFAVIYISWSEEMKLKENTSESSCSGCRGGQSGACILHTHKDVNLCAVFSYMALCLIALRCGLSLNWKLIVLASLAG